MAERPNGVHAVVWRAGEMPADLVSALGRQGISWEEAGGPFEALSRVLARRGMSRQARVLLLVEPESLPKSAEIRAAMEMFDPGTACWSYAAGGSPRLAPLPAVIRPAEPQVVVKPRPGAGGSQGLRLSGEGGPGPNRAEDARANGSGEDEAGELPPRSLLTAEELAMLLADDQG